jgi:cobalt-zinc-cadmium efflux system outer membrane protein
MSSRIHRQPWWLCVVLACSTQAQGQAVLTLQASLERSLADNPELKVAGYELAFQQSRLQQASARPPIEVGATVEDLLGTGSHRGIGAAEATLTIGWVWERGLRELRIGTARTALTAAEHEAQAKRLDAAAETARRFLALLIHQRELSELQRNLELATATHTAVQARVAAAKAPEAEQARAFAQLARARLDLEHEEHELLTASARLAAMWGEQVTDTEHPVVTASGEFATLPPLAEFAELNSRLHANPHLAQILSVARLRESELRLASAQRRSSWQFSAGVRRFEDSDDQALVFGMTVPIADRRHSQAAVAAAQTQLEKTHAQSAAMRSQLNAELFALYQEMKHAHTEAVALRDEVLPRMEAALEQARYAYDRGRYSYMEWLATQREVTDVRRALIEAVANAHRYRIEIERLTGASVSVTAMRTP